MSGAKLTLLIFSAAILSIARSVLAGETIVYTYDDLGRLVKAERSGSANDGVVADFAHDPAGNRVDYGLAGAAGGTGTFHSETPPSFSIAADRSAEEGGALTFTVNRSAATQLNYSVSWATRDGTADPQDYSAAIGTLTFSAQDASKTFVVQTTDDADYEPNETFYVDLTGASGNATFGTATRTGTIINDDTVNSPPVANADSVSVGKCLSVTVNLIANDSDPDGDTPLEIVAVGSSSMGQTAIASSSSITFAAYGSSGSTNFTYTVRDTRGAESTGYVGVTITNFDGCQ